MSESPHEIRLIELLQSDDFYPMSNALSALLSCSVALSDAEGVMLWGQANAAAIRQPLVVEQQTLGYVLADTDVAKLAAAAAIINTMLVCRWRALVSKIQNKSSVEALDPHVQAHLLTQEAHQRRLYESERFAAIGQLAAGVAHEINTPLGFMRSNLNTLSRYLDILGQIKDQQQRIGAFWQEQDIDYVLRDSQDILAENRVGMERVERIVQDLRGFSCVDTPEMEFVDPGECLRRAISMITMQKNAAVEIESTIASLPPIACQMGLLSQAFLNILRNAVQSVEYGGKVVITARFAAGESLISIQDNGLGIAPESLTHVFEPFYTTRPVGSGTGLGLTVARDAIEAHAGQIDIASIPGQGTTVNIRFAA